MAMKASYAEVDALRARVEKLEAIVECLVHKPAYEEARAWCWWIAKQVDKLAQRLYFSTESRMGFRDSVSTLLEEGKRSDRGEIALSSYQREKLDYLKNIVNAANTKLPSGKSLISVLAQWRLAENHNNTQHHLHTLIERSRLNPSPTHEALVLFLTECLGDTYEFGTKHTFKKNIQAVLDVYYTLALCLRIEHPQSVTVTADCDTDENGGIESNPVSNSADVRDDVLDVRPPPYTSH